MATWPEAIERVANAVVSVQIDQTRAFEGESPSSSQGTGFVVDAERGLILTNRHLVTAGPIVARAIFINGESVELAPVYRDPVHDFGFFRFDPSELGFLEPPALPLQPEGAAIGTEIRVVGNDAGEKLSILAGTISRLDRPAPNYKQLGYNDFNTFYIQAATGTSGGSSGSPVIDQRGRVVALASGARTDAQTSFFLPLWRVVHALDRIRAGQPVHRGSLAATLVPVPFYELRELGLPIDLEKRVRTTHPQANGMLVVQRLLPGTPAAETLELGDVVLSAAGEAVVDFASLEERLDARVGETIQLVVLRRGTELPLELPVADLHAMTPAAFVDFSGTTLHRTSYHLARNLNLPLAGFQVSLPGFFLAESGIESGSIITEFDGRRFATTAELADWLAGISDGQDIGLRYRRADQPGQERFALVRAHRSWFPERYCERPTVGPYECRDLPTSASGPPTEPLPAAEPNGNARGVDPALVHVEFRAPYGMLGFNELHTNSTGLVIDAERGWIAVDRGRVPHPMGAVSVVLHGRHEIPARVLYVHPTHGLTILESPPKLLAASGVVVPGFSEAGPGEFVTVVSSGADRRLSRRAGEVVGVRAPRPGPFKHLRFSDVNLEAMLLPGSLEVEQGVLVDSQDRVVGLLSATLEVEGHRAAIPAALLQDLVEDLESAGPVEVIEAEFQPIPLFEALRLGLDESLVDDFARNATDAAQVLGVVRTVTGTSAAQRLRSGDLLLRVNGRLVTSFAVLREALGDSPAKLLVYRDGRVLELDLPLTPLEKSGIDRVIHWSGAVFHELHRAARLAGSRPEGVYVASYFYGSPAQRHELSPLHLVVSVEGVPVATLEEFAAAVRDVGDRQTVRLTLEAWNRSQRVVTLRTDSTNWPGFDLRICDPGGEIHRSPLDAAFRCDSRRAAVLGADAD